MLIMKKIEKTQATVPVVKKPLVVLKPFYVSSRGVVVFETPQDHRVRMAERR